MSLSAEKQKHLLDNLLSDKDIFSKCQTIVQPRYFNPDLARVVEFVKGYYTQYHTIPAFDTIYAETGTQMTKRELADDQKEYTTNEIEKYCKDQALEKAVIDSIDDVKAGNGEAVKDRVVEALKVSLNRNLGLRYFEDPEKRLERMKKEPPTISTGWKDVDAALFGGYSRKELLLVSANSGGGKSITLANMALNALMIGKNVLYISLELAEDIVAQRFDTMITGISRRDWQSHISDIVTGLQIASDNPDMGVLDIVQFQSGTTANELRSYLDEFYLHHEMMPDVIVLDYLDKMGPNQKMNISDVWNKDKLCSEQLRDIGVDHNIAILTASQLNREAIKAPSHDHTHIAGGISKINECDIYWSILLDDIKKAEQVCEFRLQKTRNSDGVGKVINLKWDYKYLRILDADDDSKLYHNADKKDGLTSFNEPEEVNTGGGSLTDLIDDQLSDLDPFNNDT